MTNLSTDEKLAHKLEQIKEHYIAYKAYKQSASTSENEAWGFFENKDDALTFLIDRFPYELSDDECVKELTDSESLDTGDFILSLIHAKDIDVDHNECQETDFIDHDGQPFFFVKDARSSNVSRRELILTYDVYEDTDTDD